MGRNFVKTMATVTALTLTVACSKKAEEASITPVTVAKTLYVASGACYSGAGVTTYAAGTSSRAVTKWASDTGLSSGVFTDLNVGNNVAVGTVPQSLIDKGDHILMLTDNSVSFSDRKIFKIMKNAPGTYVTYATDPSAFTVAATHVTRSMAQDVDGTMIFSKSLFAERLNTLGVRIAKGGANPWVNPAAATGNCFTAAGSQIQQVALMSPFTNTNQGKLIYLHTGATAALNRIGIVQRTGLTSATALDCAGSSLATGIIGTSHSNAPNLIGLTGFTATGPAVTSMVYIPTPAPALTSGKLLVSYSGTLATAVDNNAAFNIGIVMYDITESSDIVATITNAKILWRDESVVFAPSAMAYDATTSSLYVAVGASPGAANQTTQAFGYNIEKFTLDTATPILTRVHHNNQPFIIGNAYTKCISHMMIAD
ncbi:MAG: hypothetical protein H7328_00205 [Bdellovibrio sp.]|nr:hypothetical protein [Bdellovibrio sp.]